MKVFSCRCKNVVHFENDRCVACKAHLAFRPEAGVGGTMVAYDEAPPEGVRLCKNGLDHQSCNWLVDAKEDEPFCVACRLNQTIPDLSLPENRTSWLKIETAKRRLVYTLLTWQLPLETKRQRPEDGLAFAFLRQEPGGPPVLTGHEKGLITLNIAEADDPHREKTRQSLGETYRTLLGHFRHESGHYYWDRLVRDDAKVLAGFHDLFGDETVPYQGALDKHYNASEKADWEDEHVSAYAAAHPWEDWAETWAHYLHLWDTTETANAFGLSLAPRGPGALSFDELMSGWPGLTLAVNGLNRSMGLRDAYPFALSPKVVQKLRFVHELVAAQRRAPSAGKRAAATR